MINEFEEQLRKEYLIIPRENKVVTPETHKILVRRAIYNSLDPNKYKWHPRYQQELKYKFEEMEHDDYINSIGIFEGDDVFDINVIRPTFTSHIIDKNTTLVPINFTLSTDEIIALIKKIKQDFQKDQNIIKTPMELLGGELETIVEAKEAQYLPNSFEKKLETMSKALFAYDKYQYLTQQQKQKEDEKKRLETLKENELKPYKKVGNSTRIERKNMMKIEKKYQPKLQKLEEEIMHIGKSSKNKYKLISNDINMSESNTERYIKFMKEYIEGKKYKKLFIKMS